LLPGPGGHAPGGPGCGAHRECNHASVGEFAADQFAFDLVADDEEEQRNEPVVDEVPELLVQPEAAEVDGDRVAPQSYSCRATVSSSRPTR
jgi:hypothetical protein